MKYLFILCTTMWSFSVLAKTPEQIRSAFLYQMAKFVEFPSTSGSGIRFCFFDLNDGPGAFLNQNRNLKIKNVPIIIKKVKINTSVVELSKQCEITYFNGAIADGIMKNLDKKMPLDMLMVSDNLIFLKNKGMASLVQEGNKIRLYINKQQISKHNFKVLSRLLAVAKFHPN